MVELLRSGEYTTAEVGDLFGVARSTVYRALARTKQAALATEATRAVQAAPRRPALADDASTVTMPAYRPRHGAPSDLPSESHNRPRSQSRRPVSVLQTAR